MLSVVAHRTGYNMGVRSETETKLIIFFRFVHIVSGYISIWKFAITIIEIYLFSNQEHELKIDKIMSSYSYSNLTIRKK